MAKAVKIAGALVSVVSVAGCCAVPSAGWLYALIVGVTVFIVGRFME